MRSIIIVVLLALGLNANAQSKSITRFRSAYPETSNLFFYSSTLKMLNTENNPELGDLLRDIEEIRVLTWEKGIKHPGKDKVLALKTALLKEDYNSLMAMNDKGNIIDLYGLEKNGKMAGFVAIVMNPESLVLIDLKGGIDVAKFMQLKQKLDGQSNEPHN